jgi:hypothetical protein
MSMSCFAKQFAKTTSALPIELLVELKLKNVASLVTLLDFDPIATYVICITTNYVVIGVCFATFIQKMWQ